MKLENISAFNTNNDLLNGTEFDGPPPGRQLAVWGGSIYFLGGGATLHTSGGSNAVFDVTDAQGYRASFIQTWSSDDVTMGGGATLYGVGNYIGPSNP